MSETTSTCGGAVLINNDRQFGVCGNPMPCAEHADCPGSDGDPTCSLCGKVILRSREPWSVNGKNLPIHLACPEIFGRDIIGATASEAEPGRLQPLPYRCTVATVDGLTDLEAGEDVDVEPHYDLKSAQESTSALLDLLDRQESEQDRSRLSGKPPRHIGLRLVPANCLEVECAGCEVDLGDWNDGGGHFPDMAQAEKALKAGEWVLGSDGLWRCSECAAEQVSGGE